MDKELLAEVGEHLYGTFWRRPLAEAIGLSERQIARYVNEDHPLNTTFRDGRNVATLLHNLLIDHDRVSQKLLDKLARAEARSRRG